MLYMPGSNARALEKARSLPADMLVFDLEDAVPPDAKEAARETVRTAIETGGYGERELIVRVNGLSTPWFKDDIALATSLPIEGILLPKVESVEMIRDASALICTVSSEIAIWCMIETPLGVLRATEIAAARGRLAGFVFGANDLVKELHARHTPDRKPIMTARSLAVLAARAYDLVAIDGVHNDLDDAAGFEAACREGADMGFDGKSLIHPKTIEPANRIYGPSEDELAAARDIVEGFAAARAEGKGVAVVDGRLVEQLHADEAERLLEMAEAIRRMSA